jgi:error-prone DNA polymerase
VSSRRRIDPSSRLPLGDDGALHANDSATLQGAAVKDPELAEELLALRRAIHARASRYVELSCRTSFSFLSGASSPRDIVHRAAELGYDTLAITDRDGLYGIVRAHEEAEKVGVRVIVGCELTLEREGLEEVPDVPGKPTTLTVLVENQTGYTNLCAVLTESHRRHPKSRASGETSRTKDLDDDELPRNVFAGVPLSVVCAHAEGLWVLADASLPLGDLHQAFGPRLSVAVHLHKDGEDRVRVTRALSAARTHGVPIVATNRVLFARPEDKPVLDVLHCIREGKTLDEAGRELTPNAEAHLKGEDEVQRIFALHPEWVNRSKFIAERCRFSIKELSYRFPYELTDLVHRDFQDPGHDRGGAKETADEALRRLTCEGARLRYGGRVPPKVDAQIEKELALIAKLEVAPYFLSVRAIVDMARRKDILCQGRGSAANSAVCFCLGITAVDPARSNMLFERFLSAERREPPDIDVDFEHERREEVIQEIYATYGRDRAAMVSEVVSYRAKSALREVGKVFGLSLEQVERLSAIVSWWDGVSSVDERRLRDAGFSASDPRVRQVLVLSRAIQGFPRHLSIHVGGFVLSASPITEIAPVEPASMPGRTIIPWDKDDIDTLGFFKIDVLGLGMLTAIRKCLDLVRDVTLERAAIATREGIPQPPYAPPGIATGTAIERLAAIPAEDPLVYEALCRADTVGVFQIESRAQMAMLPRLKPACFYDLVVEVAIVRPGPIQGGMVHPYLRRRAGEERIDPPHPILAPILERTLGVPLFQEQVMQIAIVGAGYTGGEADRLRRDMAAWRKTGKLEAHRERLLAGFRKNGIAESFGERLYQQIQGFGEYGFPESHAASFALLVYASAWLKRHYPAEFAAALVNSQPMGFYSTSTLLQDAQRHGVRLLPIDVRTSDWECTCVPLPEVLESPRSEHASAQHEGSSGHLATAIRLGLRVVNGLGEEAGRRVESARQAAPVRDAEDLAARARLDRKELVSIAEAGALDALAGGRRRAIWQVVAPRGAGLFDGLSPDEGAEHQPSFAPMSRAEQLVLDYERTGVSVADHPMLLLRPTLPARIKSSRDVMALRSGTPVSVAGLVICRQRPGTASGVVFVTMEDELGFLNLVLWSKVFEDHHHVATTSRMLLVHGRVERGDEPRQASQARASREGKGAHPPADPNAPSSVVYVIAERLEKLETRSPEMRSLGSMSRDFH